MGGFECSTHRRRDGLRLDLVDSTRHDEFARMDYLRLAGSGIRTSRDGVRWHLIESSPGHYDFTSIASQMNAAEDAGVMVIWDLFHYGYPDDLDIFSADFPKRFADFAAAFGGFHLNETGRAPIVVPVNEISFYSWVAGDEAHFFPYATGRGDELKGQLVRATLAAVSAIRSIAPAARFLASEPAVYVTSRDGEPWNAEDAESYRLSQYQTLDMLSGRLSPELGGGPEFLDIIGLNYYPHNQWYYPDREMISINDHAYRPFNEILSEIYSRYDRPLIISETGTEGENRADWFSYVAAECRTAIASGVDLQGICLYPIVDHPGWDDDRHCPNGLWGYADEEGNREAYEPLRRELRSFQLASTATRFNLRPPITPSIRPDIASNVLSHDILPRNSRTRERRRSASSSSAA